MDGRGVLVLGCGLLLGAAVGCQHSKSAQSASASAKPQETTTITHKPATYVAFGDLRARAAVDPKATPAQARQFREEARLSYQKALEVDPAHSPAYVALARLQASGGDQAGAVRLYQKALQMDERPAVVWAELGTCQARLKEWAPAAASFGKASERDPSNRQYGNMLGFALARAGRNDEALACLVRHNGEAQGHYNMARVLEHTKQPDQARRCLEIAVARDPKLEPAQVLLAQMDGQPAGGAPGQVQTVAYNEPQPQAPAPAPPAAAPPRPASGNAPASPAKPIRVPPLPVISIHTSERAE
jgi:tetratricopeptide (TPR) repeat protein